MELGACYVSLSACLTTLSIHMQYTISQNKMLTLLAVGWTIMIGHNIKTPECIKSRVSMVHGSCTKLTCFRCQWVTWVLSLGGIKSASLYSWLGRENSGEKTEYTFWYNCLNSCDWVRDSSGRLLFEEPGLYVNVTVFIIAIISIGFWLILLSFQEI